MVDACGGVFIKLIENGRGSVCNYPKSERENRSRLFSRQIPLVIPSITRIVASWRQRSSRAASCFEPAGSRMRTACFNVASSKNLEACCRLKRCCKTWPRFTATRHQVGWGDGPIPRPRGSQGPAVKAIGSRRFGSRRLHSRQKGRTASCFARSRSRRKTLNCMTSNFAIGTRRLNMIPETWRRWSRLDAVTLGKAPSRKLASAGREFSNSSRITVPPQRGWKYWGDLANRISSKWRSSG